MWQQRKTEVRDNNDDDDDHCRPKRQKVLLSTSAFAVGTFEILPFKSRKKTCGLRDTEPTRSGVHSERLEVVFVFIRLRFPLGGNTK